MIRPDKSARIEPDRERRLHSFRLPWRPRAIVDAPASVASFLVVLLAFSVASGVAAILVVSLTIERNGRAIYPGPHGRAWLVVALVLTFAALAVIVRSLAVIHTQLCGELRQSRAIKATEKRPPGLWDRDVDGRL